MAQNCRVLHETDGVFIHTTVAQADEDALVAGKIFLKKKKDGVFIEWKAEDELNGGSRESSEWTMIDSVTYKPDRAEDTGALSMNSKAKHKKYVIDFDIKDLKSFKRSRPSLGWSYIIFILQDGTTYPALHFHKGGTKTFVKELDNHLLIKKSPHDTSLYLVREQDPQALSKSFDELQLFGEQAAPMLSKFINDPFTSTLGGFSKVSNFLYTKMVVGEQQRPQEEVADMLEDELNVLDIVHTQDDTGFQVVTKAELPPRPEVFRGPPLSGEQWASHMNKDGLLTDVDGLKAVIFRGGVEPALRVEVWKFLLGYYSWESTHTSRAEYRKTRVDDYFRMKLQWKSITEDQERRFSHIRDRKALIDKDVVRTDRTHSFYEGEMNANVDTLYDILMTYCMYNFDLGYVQGMSDLLSPILLIMENEVDAFWCFAGLMEKMCTNFELDQAGMKRQLHEVNLLLRFTDPQLCNYLESHESSNMYFCFRWLLIHFKREFSFSNIMRLWEVLWTGLPCKNFHLLMCLSILDTEKVTLMENNFGFTEILKCINDLSMKIELDPMLRKTEAIYLQLENCPNLPESIQEIVGLSHTTCSSEDSSPEHRIQASPRQSPSTHQKSVNGELQSQKLHVPRDNSHNNGLVCMDDSSIEILSDHMAGDMAY